MTRFSLVAPMCQHAFRSSRGIACAAVLLALHSGVFGQSRPRIGPPAEVRGVWLTNVDSRIFDHRDSLRGAVRFLADHNFNVVFPVVWNDASTLYPSRMMDSLFQHPIDERYAGRDPLHELLEEAHTAGLAVIPWFEYGFAASFRKEGGRIIRMKPEWGARDTSGALLTKNGFEWLNAFDPEVQSFVHGLVLEVVTRYPVDGIQGDDRLPAQPVEGGYDSLTKTLYRKEHEGRFPPGEPRESSWMAWRAGKLTALAIRIHDDVKRIRPGAIVSWAPSIHPWGYEEYLQDTPTWMRRKTVDLLIPQVYRYDLASYRSALRAQGAARLGVPGFEGVIVPGILLKVGSYVAGNRLLRKCIEANREFGFPGEVFFFYEGLRANGGAAARMLKKEFYRRPARLPWGSR